MGLFFGQRKLRRTLHSLVAQCDEQAAHGIEVIHVSYSGLDVGVANSTSDCLPVVTQELARAGYQVTNARDEPWAGMVFLTVRSTGLRIH
jgi:hypothetical protein